MSNDYNKTNNEILVVIAAAVASLDTRAGHKLKVKAIRRISQTSPVWNSTGRFERLARNLNTL